MNPDCKRPKKSIRAKVLVDWLYEFFKTNFKLTKADYEAYQTRLGQLTDQKRIAIRKEARSLEGYLKVVKQDIQQTSFGLIKLPPDSRAFKENSLKMGNLEAEEAKLEGQIKELRGQLADSEKDKLTLEQFLNLVKKAERIIKSADVIKKDAICRLIFLNFSLDGEKVASYRLKEPFDTMLKTRLSLSSRQSVTAFELFFDFIKQLLKLPQLEQQITDYALLTQNQAGSRMNFVL
ncbi:hypothetical protein GYA19_02420 [Candidatus Beckwithbacteria bacterium]|nr:hypothetical protein [Candidatus Beckwithbacteria bacterium]